jgi:hypothetical protein
MLIISKRALTFNAADGLSQPLIQVFAKSRPQEVPDGVANTETFKAALKAGLVAILGAENAQVVEVRDQPPAAKQALNYRSGIPPEFR